MHRIRIPLLSSATRTPPACAAFVGAWQDIPAELSDASLVVELPASSGGDSGCTAMLQAPTVEGHVAEWFGPAFIHSPTQQRCALGDAALPARVRAQVKVPSGGGLPVAVYIEGAVP